MCEFHQGTPEFLCGDPLQEDIPFHARLGHIFARPALPKEVWNTHHNIFDSCRRCHFNNQLEHCTSVRGSLPTATRACCQSPYLGLVPAATKPTILIMTSFTLWRYSRRRPGRGQCPRPALQMYGCLTTFNIQRFTADTRLFCSFLFLYRILNCELMTTSGKPNSKPTHTRATRT